MSTEYRIATARPPVYCYACCTISIGDSDTLQWYSWTSPTGKEVFCSACLEDEEQHWGEELYLYGLASFGHGHPDTIHALLDRIGLRREPNSYAEEQDVLSGSLSNVLPQFSGQRYHYLPLSTERDHIRVLILHPNTDGGAPVVCSLETMAFDAEYSDFAAVSYTWGDPNADKSTIYIKNSSEILDSFRVLRNLHELLLHIRHSRSPRRLWIDAICINQSKDEKPMAERIGQLDLMGKIYRQASNVLIWLGLSASDDLSHHVIETICRRDVKRMQQSQFWAGMANMLSRPWFQRTWIIQKVALNKVAPYLLCGYHQVSWVRFIAAFMFMASAQPGISGKDHLDSMPRASLHKALDSSNLHNLQSVRQQVTTDGGTIIERPIYRTLLRSRKSLATDPRDRVYGLRGLMSERLLPMLPVNYKRPLEQIHQDAVRYMLIFEEGLQLFAQFPLPLSLNANTDSWPSWVPDFDSTKAALQNVHVDVDWYFSYPFRPFNFEIQTRGDPYHPQGPKPAVGVELQGSKLICKGIALDVATNFVESTLSNDSDYTNIGIFSSLNRECDALANQRTNLQRLLDNLTPVMREGMTFYNSAAFQHKRNSLLSGIPVERRLRLRVRDVLQWARSKRLSGMDWKRRLQESQQNDQWKGLLLEGDEESSLEALKFLEEMKSDIKYGPLPEEEKEAYLSMLNYEIKQGTISSSPVEILPESEINELMEEIKNAILRGPQLLSGVKIMDFTNSLLDFTCQVMILGDQVQWITMKMSPIVSKLQETVTEMQKYYISIVETLVQVNQVCSTLLQWPIDEWNTEVWHFLLDGYDNLQDIDSETFRKAFIDMVGNNRTSVSDPGEDVVVPRVPQQMAKDLFKAMRHVFHEGTKFFTCESTKLYGITTSAVKKGDKLVFLFPTWHMPIFLRPIEGSDDYQMVGPAILPSARRLALLKEYEKFGRLRDESLQNFSIIQFNKL